MTSLTMPNSAGLLERLRSSHDEKGSLQPLLNVTWQEDPKREFAAEHGLDLSWTAALLRLESDAPGSFIRLAGIADIGERQRPLFSRWVAEFWTDPSFGLRGRITDAEVRAKCDSVVRLHLDAADGVAADRRAWRDARSALTPLMDGSVTGLAIGVVAAMCWNPQVSPVIFEDICQAWDRLSEAAIDVENGFDAGAITEKLHADMDAAAAGLPPPPEWAGKEWFQTEDGLAWQKSRDVVFNDVVDNSADYKRRSELCVTAIKETAGRMVDRADAMLNAARVDA